MNRYCDNISRCHSPITIAEGNSALRWLCKECKETGIIRKDWREVPLNREYSRVFRKEILQPHQDLFYKYYSHYMKT